MAQAGVRHCAAVTTPQWQAGGPEKDEGRRKEDSAKCTVTDAAISYARRRAALTLSQRHCGMPLPQKKTRPRSKRRGATQNEREKSQERPRRKAKTPPKPMPKPRWRDCHPIQRSENIDMSAVTVQPRYAQDRYVDIDNIMHTRVDRYRSIRYR